MAGVYLLTREKNPPWFNIVSIQFSYIKEERRMSQEEGKTRNILWWAGLIALLILVVVGGLYLRYTFWSGVF